MTEPKTVELRRGVHLEWFTDNNDGDKIKYLIAHWGHPPPELDDMEAAKWILDRGPQLFAIRRDDVIQLVRDAGKIPGLEDAFGPDGEIL